jgi:hypothetical protein
MGITSYQICFKSFSLFAIIPTLFELLRLKAQALKQMTVQDQESAGLRSQGGHSELGVAMWVTGSRQDVRPMPRH